MSICRCPLAAIGAPRHHRAEAARVEVVAHLKQVLRVKG
jgi:hypothetical protein